jgi:hypothetical protein
MVARLYPAAKTAMQSGAAKAKGWILDYEPEEPQQVEPLMGWTSSGDMKQEVRLNFPTKDEAIAFCERQGIAYQVFEAHEPPPRKGLSYADNFAFGRRGAWTH